MVNLLIFLASLPAIVLLIFVYKQDKIEKEPKGLLIKLVFFGVLSIIPAVITELIGSYILGLIFMGSPGSNWLYAFIDCFFVIALSEEGFKFLMLKWGSWKNVAFNYSFDGVVYAVSTGLGFALFENIMYVVDGGVGLGFMRAFTAVVAHAVFGVIMGISYGKARQYESLGNVKKRNAYFRRALIFPMLVHGLYDFLLTYESIMMLVSFVVVLIILYVVLFVGVRRASKNDSLAVPVMPVYRQPVYQQPYGYAQPQQPVYQAPQQPVYQAPQQPVYQQPTMPVQPQQPVYPQPPLQQAPPQAPVPPQFPPQSDQ